MMDAPKSYYYANGSVSVLSLKLLTGERFLRMAECATLSDALKILYEVNYSDGMTVDEPNNFEHILEREWNNAVKFVESVTAEKSATDCFLISADFHNLKVLMKQKYMRQESGNLLLASGLFDWGRMAAAVLRDDYKFLPVEISEALEQIDREFYSGNRKPAVIDILLDKAYYKTVLRLLKKSKTVEVKNYFTTEIDGKNILSFFRTKKATLNKNYFDLLFIEGGSFSKEFFDRGFEYGDEKIIEMFRGSGLQEVVRTAVEEVKNNLPLTESEVKFLNIKKNIITPHKSEPDGILPLINYLLAKRTEIENLRLVLVCVKNQTDKNKIVKRLRELYV